MGTTFISVRLRYSSFGVQCTPLGYIGVHLPLGYTFHVNHQMCARTGSLQTHASKPGESPAVESRQKWASKSIPLAKYSNYPILGYIVPHWGTLGYTFVLGYIPRVGPPPDPLCGSTPWASKSIPLAKYSNYPILGYIVPHWGTLGYTFVFGYIVPH